VPAGATLPDTSALGNFSVALANTAAGPTVTGLRSETFYRACVVAADVTRLQNKQPAVNYKDFRTLDVTPPSIVVTPTPGTDGNFTCSRWVLPADCSAGQQQRHANQPKHVSLCAARIATAAVDIATCFCYCNLLLGAETYCLS
jgi:hypothetical protein